MTFTRLFMLVVTGVFLWAGYPAHTTPTAKSPAEVIQAYVQALGGTAAIARVETREVHAKQHHGAKLTYYWKKPNQVLLLTGKERLAWDGGSGWMLSSKKKITKLSKGLEQALLMDANADRYAHLEQLYSEVNAAPAEAIDGQRMDVLVAPNDLGRTKFYFDCTTHLLTRIDETGVVSAYFRHVTDFANYRAVDGLKLPFQIVHHSTEPGVKTEETDVSKILQNVPLKPNMFVRPSGSSVVMGGKR